MLRNWKRVLVEVAIFILFLFGYIQMRLLIEKEMVDFRAPFFIVYMLPLIFYFALGIFLGTIGKTLKFQLKNIQVFYLFISIVCMGLIVFFFTFPSWVPAIYYTNMGYINNFLMLFAGATFISAFLIPKK